MDAKASLKDIAKLFLKLGIIGFGGPAVHIAMMQDEVVIKRKWLSETHFLDLLGATNLIPGPNSTEMAIHIGYEKGGWKGLLVAGLCFILPAVFITGILAYFYAEFGQLSSVQPFIYGIKPAIIAIVLAAIYPLAIRFTKTNVLRFIGILVLIGSFLAFNEIFLLFGAGFFMLSYQYFKKNKNQGFSILPVTFLSISTTDFNNDLNTRLFFIFLKIGAILYGSGYVLFAFLDAELVTTGLLTREQLINAIAVGQFTPGPVFSAVTFIGYQINGISGAFYGTIAIFLPSFLFVALLNPLVKIMRKSDIFGSFLDGVNVAAIAIILAISYALGKEAITDWKTILIAIISLVFTLGCKKINSAIVVLGGSLLGYVLYLF
jgi:chromate transporter